MLIPAYNSPVAQKDSNVFFSGIGACTDPVFLCVGILASEAQKNERISGVTEFNKNSTPLPKVQLFYQTIINSNFKKSSNTNTLQHIAKRYKTLEFELITRRSQVQVLSPQPESPDFLRNQDFFRTFLLNNLLAVFSDPNADPNGSVNCTQENGHEILTHGPVRRTRI